MIRYMPNLEPLWARKSLEYFESVEEMKEFVAEQRTKICRFIGKDKSFIPDDVELQSDRDRLLGWNNFCNVILDGTIIGFCGE